MKPLTVSALLLAVAAMAGCSNLSGVGGSSEYACPAPEGPSCKSMSQIYRESHHAVAATTPADDAASEATVSKPKAPVLSAEVGTPLLTGPRLMRILFAPWTDVDDNLMEEHRVFVKIEESRWRLDHVKASLYRTYGPIAAPAGSSEQPAAPAAATATPVQVQP